MIQSIEVAVHADVRQSVNSIRRNISTEEEPIQATKTAAVRRVVRRAKEHEMKSKSPVERGFVPNGDIGTLKEYASHHSMAKLIKRHNDNTDTFHLNYYTMFLASSMFYDDSTDFSMFFTNIFMLTTVFRIHESGWPLNFAVDLFHRFCTADVKMIGYGMLTLGGRHNPVLFGTIPDKHGESKRMYQSAWKVLCVTLRRFVRDWKPCSNASCEQCKETQSSMTGRRVKSWIRNEGFQADGLIPVRAFISDNSIGLLKMIKEDVDFIGVLFIICAAHLNGALSFFMCIPFIVLTYALVVMGSHRQAGRFMDKVVFRMFKHFLTTISRMTESLPVKYMQTRCIEYLRENNEDAALKWFESTWTGERGTWTRMHAGPGCANTNNALESGWGRFRAVIPRHYSYAEYMSTMLKHMLELFSPTFNHASPQYQKCVGKTLTPPLPLLNTEISC